MALHEYPRGKYINLESLTDVFGEHYYVKEVLYDETFKLSIYAGRPFGSPRGGNKYIVTEELKAFILSTVDVPCKEFNGVLKIGKVCKLRRLLRDNPFKSYEDWVSSEQANKPSYITFNDARNNPQILIDMLGHRYVLSSALRIEGGLILPMGLLESHLLDKNKKPSPKYILTNEIATWLKEIDFNKGNKDIPLSGTAFYHLCAELGHKPCDIRDDRDAFWVKHLNELINSTAKEFLQKHPELDITQKGVMSIKRYFILVLREMKKPQSVLIPVLFKHWKQPNSENARKVNTVYGRCSSKVRRAFLLLKRAKNI